MPTTEPDDRSIPPMMMTCVTPTAMMPISASCRIMILSLSGLAMKLWPTNIQPKTSNKSIMPIMTARMLSSGRRSRCRWPRALSLSSALLRRELHDPHLGRILAVDDAGHSTFVHHEDPVAHPQDLRQLRRNHEHRHALHGQLGDQLVDLGLGADVDAPGRLVEDEDLRFGHQPARDQDFLLIAARKIDDRLFEIRRSHAQAIL